MRHAFLLLALTLAACGPDAPPAGAVPVLTGDLASVDDGAAVPGFPAFRDTMRAITARRDTAALLGLVAPDARLSFGDDAGGPDGFRTMWFEGDAPPEPVWVVLDRVLQAGSVEEDGAVVVPSVAALWPDALDPFTHIAIPGDDVPALDAPGGREIARLSRIVLPVAGPPSGGWWPVSLPDGQAAVVPEADGLSPVGYRATVWDDGDGWQLRSFLTGD